jgi:hypothetical protein
MAPRRNPAVVGRQRIREQMIARRKDERAARAQRDKENEADLLAVVDLARQIDEHRCSVIDRLEREQGQRLAQVKGRGVAASDIADHLALPPSEVHRLIKLVADPESAAASQARMGRLGMEVLERDSAATPTAHDDSPASIGPAGGGGEGTGGSAGSTNP